MSRAGDQVASDERDRKDAHQRAVAARVLVRRPGVHGRDARGETPEGLRRRPTDVEQAVAVRRVGAVPLPRERAASLVVRVEPVRATGVGVEQRIEQRQHQRAVVAPGAGRLAVRSRCPEARPVRRPGLPELVGHAHGVADEVAPDGARQARGEDHGLGHGVVPPYMAMAAGGRSPRWVSMASTAVARRCSSDPRSSTTGSGRWRSSSSNRRCIRWRTASELRSPSCTHGMSAAVRKVRS